MAGRNPVAVHPVDDGLDAAAIASDILVLQQFGGFLPDPQIVCTGCAVAAAPVHFLLVVFQLPEEQLHHARMVFILDGIRVQAVAHHTLVQGTELRIVGIGLLPVVLAQLVVKRLGDDQLFELVAIPDGSFFQFLEIARRGLRLAFLFCLLDFRPEPCIVVLSVHGKDKCGQQGDRPKQSFHRKLGFAC